MKQILKNIGMSVAFALLIVLAIPQYAQAYVETDYEINDEEIWFVTNQVRDIEMVPVTLYVIVPAEYANYPGGFSITYPFSCLEGTFEWTGGTVENTMELAYRFNTVNQQNILTDIDLDGFGVVYQQQFAIEPGKYIFTDVCGNENITLLTASLGIPFPEYGYTYTETFSGDEIMAEIGTPIYLYGIYGTWEERSSEEFTNVLSKFGKEMYEKNHKNDDKTVDSEETIEVAGEGEPEEESKEVEENTVNYEETETASEEMVVVEEETKSTFLDIVKKTWLGIVLFIVLLFALMKRKKKK